MHSRKPIVIITALLSALPIVAMFISWPTTAQGPIPYTPGVPLFELTPTSTLIGENECFIPLGFEPGQDAFIEPGVNIRNQPSQSGALVWNTIYENRNERGEVIPNPLAVPVTIQEGPVCSGGFNWWRITGTGNPGWVAEGRPDQGGYFIFAPGVGDLAAPCQSRYDFAVGDTVDLQFNARVREAPNPQSLTRTVAQFGNPVQIIGGAECVAGVLWWLVRVTVLDVVYEGWMAEQGNFNDLIVPQDLPSAADGTLCGDPLELAIGSTAYVDYEDNQPKSLRAAPDRDAALLFTLVNNVPLIIEGGPVCSGNLNWWQVTVRAGRPVTGWMAEGSPFAGYWINPNTLQARGFPPE
jgi:hypothetical protein